MKNEKNYMRFHIPKIWQRKRFARSFHQAQTSYYEEWHAKIRGKFWKSLALIVSTKDKVKNF